jgi:AcrR family transcriptional regulator
MARALDTARRAELLEQTVRYAASKGIAGLSLRPLAAALGTSSRMLVHYFGTKESLLDQALAAIHPHVPALLTGHTQAGHTPAQIATRLWQNLCDGEQQPRLRVLLEVMALALTQPHRYGRHATEAINAWVTPLARALQETGHGQRAAAARATLLVSGLRGLALDRYLTGAQQRTDDAAELLIATATETGAPTIRQSSPGS